MTRALRLARALALLALSSSAIGAAAEDAPRFTGQVVPQLAHTQEILDIVYPRSGAFLATSAKDGTVKLWTPDGRLLRTLDVAAVRPRIAIAPDAATLAVAGNGTVELWSTQGKRLRYFPRMDAVTLGAVAFSPDGSYVVACTGPARRSYCQLFDLGGQPLARFDTPVGLSGTVAVVVAPGGEVLYTAGEKSVVKWHRSGKQLARFEPGPEFVSALALSPDGTRLATAAGDRGLFHLPRPGAKEEVRVTRLFDADGKQVGEFPSHRTRDLRFSDDGGWIVSGGSDDGLVLVHDRDGHPVARLTVGKKGEDSPAHVALAPDRSLLAVASHRFKPVSLRLYDLEGRLVSRFSGAGSGVIQIALDPTGGVIVTTASDGQVRFWTLDGRLVRRFSAEDDYPELLAVEPRGRFLVTGSAKLVLWDGRGKALARARVSRGSGRALAFSPDGKTLYAGDSRGEVTVVPLEPGAKPKRFRVYTGDDVSALAVSPGGDLVAAGGTHERFRIVDRGGAVRASFDNPKGTPAPFSSVRGLAFTPDGRELIVVTARNARQLAVFDLQGRLLRSADTGNRYLSGALAVSPSGKLAAVTVNSDVGLFDVATMERRATFRRHQGSVRSLAFTRDERHLVSGSNDGTVQVWNLENGASFSLLSQGDDWVIYTDDGYFDASRRGGDLVALVDGMEAYGVEQVALRFNRPDLIYRRAGIGDEAFLEHLRLHYEDRLRRAGLKTETGSEVDPPRVRILSHHQEGDALDLRIAAEDARDLQALQVAVNGVPVRPDLGRPLQGRRAEVTERVTLGQGRNRVEVSAVNRAGFESRRAAILVERPAGRPGVLWFVGLGISKYRDTRLDLHFAHRDVTALAAALRGARGRFRDVRTLELTDARATRGALDEIRSFLAPAAVDDTVVLLASGHGARAPDALATFYFVTHEADPANLAATTIAYDELEGLLDGIGPRRKLLLVDACQSGELDPDALAAVVARAGATQLAARVGPGPARQGAPRRPYLYLRDRYVYARLERRTGAIVFSSSLGNEVSLESATLGNGVFTAALLRVLAAKQADGDGLISIDALEGAVKATVVGMTGGLQHPTIDRDNALVDFRLPALR
jgi:WD40 repeat protein